MFKQPVLVGDLDSISAHGKMWAYAHEVEIDEYPVDKDATDTDIALHRAAGTAATDLIVLGGCAGLTGPSEEAKTTGPAAIARDPLAARHRQQAPALAPALGLAALGGDPARVTIAGESAGSIAVRRATVWPASKRMVWRPPPSGG